MVGTGRPRGTAKGNYLYSEKNSYNPESMLYGIL